MQTSMVLKWKGYVRWVWSICFVSQYHSWWLTWKCLGPRHVWEVSSTLFILERQYFVTHLILWAVAVKQWLWVFCVGLASSYVLEKARLLITSYIFVTKMSWNWFDVVLRKQLKQILYWFLFSVEPFPYGSLGYFGFMTLFTLQTIILSSSSWSMTHIKQHSLIITGLCKMSFTQSCTVLVKRLKTLYSWTEWGRMPNPLTGTVHRLSFALD